MAEKTEMVLVSRDELQQLIGASVRCALEEYGQAQAPQDTSEYYTIRQLAENWRTHRDREEQEIYIRQLSVLSGLKPEEPVDEQRPEQLIRLVQAIGRVENSGEPLQPGDVQQGWLLYLG